MRRFTQTTIFCILILPLFIFSCGGEESGSTKNNTVKSDISFELTSLQDGSEYTFENFKGKPTVLNFWASWCVPCRDEMPFLQETWEKRKSDNINIVGINVMDNEEEALNVLNDFNITYINLYDRGGKVSSKFGVLGLPATIFINRNGEIVKKYSGPFLGEKGEKSFNELLGEIL